MMVDQKEMMIIMERFWRFVTFIREGVLNEIFVLWKLLKANLYIDQISTENKIRRDVVRLNRVNLEHVDDEKQAKVQKLGNNKKQKIFSR